MFRINKKAIIIVLVILSLASIVYITSKIKWGTKVIPQTTKNTSQATFKSLIPGKSTEEDVSLVFGKSLKTDSNTSEYQSSSPNENHKVVFENRVVSLIKEIVTFQDNKKASDIIDVYGVPQNILYGSYSSIGFFLFVYPENGLAYIGNPNGGGVLLEIWYFSPTDIDNFKKNYAPNYSSTPKTIPPDIYY